MVGSRDGTVTGLGKHPDRREVVAAFVGAGAGSRFCPFDCRSTGKCQ